MPTKIVSLLFLLLSGFSTLSQGNNLELGIYELNRGEFHAAIEQFRPLVAEGYAPAQYQMAIVYQHGYGVAKNGMKALALFELAAKQNYSDAQFELALIYNEGKLVPQNLKKAYELTHKAATKGLASAQFNLAVMFANGTGIKQDDFKASRWYQRAADQNYALAQYNLALLYSEGKGVEKSTEMSLVWNTIASWNGYPHANQSRLLDERQLSKAKKDSAIEKANQFYKKIKNQEKIKAEMAQKKDLY
ncbi:MAG: tetratricopeptide repeat protein [Colwellia sp.]|nr:tetratricopeptide repeat protein [Colwellia sp.]